MQSNKLIIEYIFTEQVAVTGSIEVTKSVSPLFRYSYLIGLANLIIIFLLIYLGGKYTSNIIIPIIFSILFLIFPLLARLKAESNFKKNPNANSKIKYFFDNDSLEIEGEGTQGKYDWNKIIRVERKTSGMLFFPQTRIAHWIPISAMDEESLGILENILTNNQVKYKVIA